VSDGLLLTRAERSRLFWLKFAAGAGPALLVAIVALALGGGSVAWAIAIFGVLIGLLIALNARRVRGAAIGGTVIAALLTIFQIVIAWFVTHPIQ
jgi:hypothetical protein